MDTLKKVYQQYTVAELEAIMETNRQVTNEVMEHFESGEYETLWTEESSAFYGDLLNQLWDAEEAMGFVLAGKLIDEKLCLVEGCVGESDVTGFCAEHFKSIYSI